MDFLFNAQVLFAARNLDCFLLEVRIPMLNPGPQDVAAGQREHFHAHQMMLCKLCLLNFSAWLNKSIWLQPIAEEK